MSYARSRQRSRAGAVAALGVSPSTRAHVPPKVIVGGYQTPVQPVTNVGGGSGGSNATWGSSPCTIAQMAAGLCGPNVTPPGGQQSGTFGSLPCTIAQMAAGLCGPGSGGGGGAGGSSGGGSGGSGGSTGGGGSGGGGYGGGGGGGYGGGYSGGYGGGFYGGAAYPPPAATPAAPTSTAPAATNYVCWDGSTVADPALCPPQIPTTPTSVWGDIVAAAQSIPWWVYAAAGGYLLLRKKTP